jgi:hypothetical protein
MIGVGRLVSFTLQPWARLSFCDIIKREFLLHRYLILRLIQWTYVCSRDGHGDLLFFQEQKTERLLTHRFLTFGLLVYVCSNLQMHFLSLRMRKQHGLY